MAATNHPIVPFMWETFHLGAVRLFIYFYLQDFVKFLGQQRKRGFPVWLAQPPKATRTSLEAMLQHRVSWKSCFLSILLFFLPSFSAHLSLTPQWTSPCEPVVLCSPCSEHTLAWPARCTKPSHMLWPPRGMHFPLETPTKLKNPSADGNVLCATNFSAPPCLPMVFCFLHMHELQILWL